MLRKKPQIDVKKSLQKFTDTKKDSLSRLRHLRIVIENVDIRESKEIFEHQSTQIYHVFFDSFINLDSTLKQRGHKANREELDSVFIIFEKILTLLPELLKKRWQIQSIATILRKLLHHGNTVKMFQCFERPSVLLLYLKRLKRENVNDTNEYESIRTEGMRLFLIWYQILGESATNDIEQIYLSLVPGLISGIPNNFLQLSFASHQSSNLSFYGDSNGNNVNNDIGNITDATGGFSIQSYTIEPFMPTYSVEPNQPHDVTCYYLQCMMDYMITQISRVYWREKCEWKQTKCFEFLVEMFRKRYLMNIFPNLTEISIYQPAFELPLKRSFNDEKIYADLSRFPHRDTLIHCQSVVIRWFAKYIRNESDNLNSRDADDGSFYSKMYPLPQNVLPSQDFIFHDYSRDPTPFEYEIFRNTFNSSRAYINLIHSLFHQSFLLPFTHAITMKRVISLYRDWIYKTTISIPLFLEEPLSNANPNANQNDDVRAGMSNLLRLFVHIASNVFLLDIPHDKPLLLEEQIEMCKRVLNIYRYMVMKIEMDKSTWEQLINVLLQITYLVLSIDVPPRKDDTLGGRLSPALFQTLIVTWIKANINVHVNNNLWEKFHGQLSSLTKWDELIKEWCKTMDTLTRVMARYVYNINLHDLPLERPSERTKKKIRGMRDESIKIAETSVKVNREGNSEPKSATESTASIRKRSNSGETPIGPLSRQTSKSQHKIIRSHSDSHLCINRRNLKTINSKDAQKVRVESDKSRSLDLLYRRIESPIWSESSVSRTPSPTPSNVIESNSLKDSPMNFDSVNTNINTTSSAKCVLIGGTFRGWGPESAIILWRRMLGILGDINKISDFTIHAQAMECLSKITEDLLKVRENLGLSADNDTSPSSPLLLPPMQYIAPWLFKTTQLPNEFKAGKLIAYKLLCVLTVRRNDIEPSKDYLSLFYKVLHQGFASNDTDIISIIIKYCGPKFFSLGLSGSSCLVFDFMNAANSIVTSQENKLPRGEALHLLGSLIGLHTIFNNILVLQPRTPQLTLMNYKDTKDHVLEIILNSSKKEQTGLGRSVALSSLGIFLYQELQNRTNHHRMREITNVLIAGTRVSLKIPNLNNISDSSNPSKFNNRVLCRVACDMLRLQCDHSTYLLDNHPEIPKKIIEGLCSTLLVHYSLVQRQNLFKEYKNILLTLMFCLGQWCMSVPKLFLQCTASSEKSDESLMLVVLRALSSIATGIEFQSTNNVPIISSSPNPHDTSIVYTIHDDNLLSDSGMSPHSSPKKKSPDLGDQNATNKMHSENDESDNNTIRLAAKLLIGYFLNYLGHFPQPNLGASRLSCFINETDDNSHVTKSDVLDNDVFNAPNVIFFVVNNSSVISFVELNGNENEVSSPKIMRETKVRIIVRNLLGKFAWDCKHIFPMKENVNFTGGLTLTKGLSFDRDDKLTHESRDNDDDDDDIYTETDELEMLHHHLMNTSPECFGGRSIKKSSFSAHHDESDTIALLTNQHFQESRYVEERILKRSHTVCDQQQSSINFGDINSAFQYSRQLIDQLGFLFWEKRNRIDLLAKNQNVLREIRNLDNQKCRETHKIAVIYVGKGQEDKRSILSNSSGSRAFEEFVAGLGWEINLETHFGFRGGLQQNNSTGKSTPYYANSFIEVIFHVSTRICSPNDESDLITKKMRHLGNDEVHIVWSEHTRDYRRGIIPTEFCDALIVIYPLRAYAGLYYIHISRKPEVPFFGPLFTGAIVHHDVLPGLVRATAVNASRANRMHTGYYLNYFEERARSFNEIVKNHKEKSSFEDFSSKIYSPKELEIIFSRPLSGLSMTTDTVSISSVNNSLNYMENQPQTPTLKSRPLSMSGVDQRITNKIIHDRPVSASSQQSLSPIGYQNN